MATNKKKYNFKGLDSIFGESVTDIVDVIDENPSKAKELATTVKVDLLKPNPYQPRKSFNDEELQELAESIKIHGIIQPIIVNKNGNKYEIVAGERRTRAAKLAGLKEVPVIELSLSEQQMEEFSIIENIQRVDLTDIEEAIAYKRLSQNLNLKQEEIAQRVGKSRSHVANIMRLLNLPENIQKAMLDGLVSMGQTKPLLSILSNEKLVQDVFKKIVKDNLTAREVEKLIKNLQSGNTNIKEEKIKSADIKSMENKFMRSLGTKVTIDNKKITISYADASDLNRILEILGMIEE